MLINIVVVFVYGFYGEVLINSDFGFVYIEDIVICSSELGWWIKFYCYSWLL